MATTNKNKHLTLEERSIIETSIRNGSTKTAIATVLGKDKSTIGKEIKEHRHLSYKSPLPRDCSKYKECRPGGNCIFGCPNYSKFTCKRRDRSPGACNGCERISHCRFDKYTYKADLAHEEYMSTLVDSRLGVNLTTSEAESMGKLIKPLLMKGQSPYQIIQTHPELGITERTLYTYIETGVFRIVGITQSDLRRQVSRKILKNKKTLYKKREDRKFLIGRLFKDYLTYIEENENAKIVQMDTVYNDGSNGPFIQTFKFVKYGFLFGIYHEEKTAEVMVNGIDILEYILGNELFIIEVEVLLTDRGSEFCYAEEIEKLSNGSRRTRLYYCDPMQSSQKATIENNHIELRYILPKETNLKALGLQGQDDLNLVLSHINSMPKEKLEGKSAFEYMEFLNPKLAEKFKAFGIKEIEKDKVTLKPYLLKK